jgi:hypothetical protein
MTGIFLAFHPEGPKLEVIESPSDSVRALGLASEADPKKL